MKKLRGEFKEQLEELKESLTERFHSIDERIQRLKLELPGGPFQLQFKFKGFETNWKQSKRE